MPNTIPQDIANFIVKLDSNKKLRFSYGRITDIRVKGRDLSPFIEAFNITPAKISITFSINRTIDRLLFEEPGQLGHVTGELNTGFHISSHNALVSSVNYRLDSESTIDITINLFNWILTKPTPADFWVLELQCRNDIISGRSNTSVEQYVYMESESNVILRKNSIGTAYTAVGSEYEYYFVKVNNEENEESRDKVNRVLWYLIIKTEHLDLSVLDKDFMLLELCLCEKLYFDTIYGISSGEIIAIHGVEFGDFGRRQYLPIAHIQFEEFYFTADFFYKLSIASSSENNQDKWIEKSCHYYLESLYSPLEHAYLQVQVAINALVSSMSKILPYERDPADENNLMLLCKDFELSFPEEYMVELVDGQHSIFYTGSMERDLGGNLNQEERFLRKSLRIGRLRMVYMAILAKFINYGGSLPSSTQNLYPKLVEGLSSRWWKAEALQSYRNKIVSYKAEVKTVLSDNYQSGFHIITEDEESKIIIDNILFAARVKYPELPDINVSWNKLTRKELFNSVLQVENEAKYIVLINSLRKNIPDLISDYNRLDRDRVRICAAVPNVYSWLFADDKTLINLVNSNNILEEQTKLKIKEQIARLPLPEEIELPKESYLRLFGESLPYKFLNSIDIERAASRSFTLRYFLRTVSSFESAEYEELQSAGLRSMSRDILASLLSEIYPSSEIAWTSESGVEYTASELGEEIRIGTRLGREYSSDLLRIARDLLHRKAKRKKSK